MSSKVQMTAVATAIVRPDCDVCLAMHAVETRVIVAPGIATQTHAVAAVCQGVRSKLGTSALRTLPGACHVRFGVWQI